VKTAVFAFSIEVNREWVTVKRARHTDLTTRW